jgi:hypothetical protein
VLDDKWVLFGGRVSSGGKSSKFWTPTTGIIPMKNPDNYAVDIWTWDFCSQAWTTLGCPPINNATNTSDSCIINHRRTALFFIYPHNILQHGALMIAVEMESVLEMDNVFVGETGPERIAQRVVSFVLTLHLKTVRRMFAISTQRFRFGAHR